jgi:hypothetical protein
MSSDHPGKREREDALAVLKFRNTLREAEALLDRKMHRGIPLSMQKHIDKLLEKSAAVAAAFDDEADDAEANE